MAENQPVNLDGTEWITNIPSIFFDSISNYLQKFENAGSAGKYVGRISFGAGTSVSTIVNLAKDPDNPGKVIASTVAANGIVYYASSRFVSQAIVSAVVGSVVGAAALVGVTLSAPVVLTLTAIGSVGAAVVSTYVGNALQGQIYKALEEFENFDIYAPELTGTVTQEEFILQSLENNPTFCMDAFPKYKNYRQRVEIHNKGENLVDVIRYDSQSKEATIQTSDDYEDDYVTRLFKTVPEIKQLTLNAQTYNVVDEDNKLLIRNAIEDIPKVSFLLSHILIKPDEILDVGDQGVYTIKCGDTMSQIAEAYGMSTKELLKLNTWLIDEGKVHFDQGVNIFTCKDFKANKSLHVRTKNNQKGEQRGTEQKVA